MRPKTGVKPVYIGILTEKKSELFSDFLLLFGFQKVTSADYQRIKGFKRGKIKNFSPCLLRRSPRCPAERLRATAFFVIGICKRAKPSEAIVRSNR